MPNTLSKLLYHVVFSTKQRTPFIELDLQSELYAFIDGVVRRQDGALLAIGGIPDHVHLLLRLRTYMPVAKMLRIVKANTSRWLNEERGLEGAFAWQRGYGAFSVSESNAAAVRRYIQEQEAHHRTMSSREEMIRLLRKHRIGFDPDRLDE